MKKLAIFAVIAIFACSSGTALSQESKDKPMPHSMKGYLVDHMCATNMVKKGPEEAMLKAAKHTRSCALDETCMESGYGIMSQGKWYKFDDKGNKEALALLQKTKSKNDIMVEVTGLHKGDTFDVKTIKQVKDDTKYKPKEETKKSDMKMDDMK
jgi:hypothetical protein